MNTTCRTCHYWGWLDDEFDGQNDNMVHGWCKRYPPQHLGLPEDEERPSCQEWGQPITLHHHWCGEWRPVCNDSFRRPLPEDWLTPNVDFSGSTPLYGGESRLSDGLAGKTVTTE